MSLLEHMADEAKNSTVVKDSSNSDNLRYYKEARCFYNGRNGVGDALACMCFMKQVLAMNGVDVDEDDFYYDEFIRNIIGLQGYEFANDKLTVPDGNIDYKSVCAFLSNKIREEIDVPDDDLSTWKKELGYKIIRNIDGRCPGNIIDRAKDNVDTICELPNELLNLADVTEVRSYSDLYYMVDEKEKYLSGCY